MRDKQTAHQEWCRTAPKYTIECRWDDVGKTWVATSPDIIGLVMQGRTLTEAFVKAAEILPALMPYNKQASPRRTISRD